MICGLSLVGGEGTVNWMTVVRLMRQVACAWTVIIGIFSGVCTASFARPMPVAGDSEYLIDAWETDEGLPENSATAMVQTPDGYLWIGTFNGLARFDGAKFTVYDPGNTPTLPSAAIVNLHLDGTGRLWVSTARGLVTSQWPNWTDFHLEEGSTGNYTRTFAERAGVLCITSFDGKVARVEKGRLQELPDPPGAQGQGCRGYVDSSGGFLWELGWRALADFAAGSDGDQRVCRHLHGAGRESAGPQIH